MLPALAVANHFLQRAEQQSVVLVGERLQSLVYLAHGLRLGLVGEPLLDEPVFAGPAGVSIASLNVASATGGRPVQARLTEVIRRSNGLLDEGIPVLHPEEPALITLDHVWQRFWPSSAEALTRLICKTGSPWHATWHSPERLLGRFAVTLSNTWDPLPESERPVAIANTTIRNWFRAALIRDHKQRAMQDGLEETVRIDAVRPEHLKASDGGWDASISIPAV